ncbi:MAG TPA: serine/threonine-protein kinase [Polyangiaceae bacterium]|nr:serine/threonine-protein kinase [Polyangiaceae bacterium]
MPAPSEDTPPVSEATRAPPRPLLGEVISGRYRVTKLLATGGVSCVYLGQHVHMLKHVAIKVLDPNAEKLPEFVSRFRREAVAGAHVQHPNIASATDFGQLEDGSYFLVQEYVPGQTLTRVIAGGRLPPLRAVAIARKLASALGAAHDVGIIHRDLKPSNVILVEGTDDVVKLIDFGFAKLRFSDVPTLAPPADEPAVPERLLTAAGVVLGTVAYLAPEAALGMSAVDQRSDLYALGLILYELLAGLHPFDATEPVRLFLQQRIEPPPPIAIRSPGATVPPELESVVRKLLEKDPQSRYASAAEVISALDGAMLSAGFDAVPEIAAGPPPEALSQEAVAPTSAPAPFDTRAAAIDRAAAPLSGMAKLVEMLPADGRFPRWAYVAFPALGLIFVLILVLLSARASPSAEDSATEAPADSASTEARPGDSAAREVTMEVAGLDASGWRMNLRNAARRKEWPAASEAVLTLLRLDPTAFRDHDVQAALRNTAVGLEDTGGAASDKFFDTLSAQAGSDGLDLVYDVARFRAGTKAGKRATEILRRPEVMLGGSPALKVLFDFREASCVGRRDLFSRMAEQGDERALGELVAQRDADCGRRDPCCYKESRALGTAIRSLKARLSAPPSAASASP